MKKKKTLGLLLGLALALSVALPGTLMTSAAAQTMASASNTLYECVMASTTLTDAKAALSGATDQEIAALTEAQNDAIDAHVVSLMSAPLPAVTAEASGDKPVQSEIIYPTVTVTDAAPLGSPVVGGAN